MAHPAAEPPARPLPSPHVPPRHEAPVSTDQGARHPVVVAGAGPVGLTAALALALRGQRVVVLDDDDSTSGGSRAVCLSRHTLEILSRLGLGPALGEKGVGWRRGWVLHGSRRLYTFELEPEGASRHPPFLNLQQYHLEEALVAACAATGRVDLRWRHRVANVEPGAERVELAIDTPHGPLALAADWLLACDGADSTVRGALGLAFPGEAFAGTFLVADVAMQPDFPTERWFWFNPPFHPEGAVLLHRQADDIWRVDFQLGPDGGPSPEETGGWLAARLAALLGPEVSFAVHRAERYRFRSARLARFRHHRVLFLGDAAHQVSPFGARGGNSGIHDADNLAWKLLAVLKGHAPASLLDSYDAERVRAADENMREAARSLAFIAPADTATAALRDAALELAGRHAFARPLVNTGRLIRPAVLTGGPLETPDATPWPGGVPPGAPAPDAPLLCDGREAWLLDQLAASGFSLLLFGPPDEVAAEAMATLAARTRHGGLPVHVVFISPEEADGVLWDRDGAAAARFEAQPGTAVLLRPDRYVAARWREFDPVAVAVAWRRAHGAGGTEGGAA